ncbi:hypothetical protein CBR_g29297 [Chara braunii]|uniref:ER membrane protein complex subunit 4 n=1 Tax=Chara braunii TaxID=69332 RepID=A0A388LAC8_CHABU|nr:hypothetical protein CBR_g29297 [Chara braunii]|eukprot:GBG79246.1 hypothetical protein CBR_g29297 [Chara braunii]
MASGSSSGSRTSSRRWNIEFGEANPSTSRSIHDPLGFDRRAAEQDEVTVSRQKKEMDANWKERKAREAAQAPMRNIFMMGLMMWMAGNSVSLFSVPITFSAIWSPISALRNMNLVFDQFKDDKIDLVLPKLIFISLNLVGCAMGLYKLNSLGLLPTTPSDWVSSLPIPQAAEFSAGGITYS